MSLPNNILQQVQTYQDGALAYLQNLCCFVSTANTRFKDFNKLTANLGDTVTFDRPPRYTTTNGTLVATFQPSTQLVQTLTVSQAVNTAYAFSDQQFIFNTEEYMEKFGKSAIYEIGTQIESDVAGLAESAPYRCYGNGTTAINSFGQLAQILANYRNFGAPAGQDLKVYLPDLAVPAIVNSGLNQFTPARNDKMAMSWEVGEFGMAKFYQSNLLPIHTAGTVGNDALTLTLVSTNDPTGQNVTQLTFSGANISDANSIALYDTLTFQDGVSGQPNLRFLTYIGHKVSGQQVQVQATAAAGSNGSGDVTVSVYPALVWAGTANQNLNVALAAGMQVTVLPNHRCGLVVGGDAMYVAIPALPGTTPFPYSSKSDPSTGVSTRMYYGTLFGQAEQGFIHDCIWGKTAVADYVMKIAFPITV